MDELKAKLEAILFCSPEGLTLDKLARQCCIGSKGHVRVALESLKEDYGKRKAGLEIVGDEGTWKLKIKDEHIEIAKEAAKPEMDNATLETLSYIAWKKKIKQSDLIKARTTNAYEHIRTLLERRFIERHKQGSTFLLHPTKKFYDYFELDPNQELGVSEDVQQEQS